MCNEHDPLLRREVVEDAVDGAHALLRLGALYMTQDAFTQAEPLAEEALAITERTLGSDHPRVASCLMIVSLLHSRRDNYDRAVPELQRALTIAERGLNPGLLR